MTLDDITDYDYENKSFDFAKLFHVEQLDNRNGSVDTFYNINDGFTIDGVDSLPEDKITTYTCRNGDDLRFIAYDCYGNTSYWWMIAKINGMENCLEKLEAGRKLRILPLSYMNYIFDKIKENI